MSATVPPAAPTKLKARKVRRINKLPAVIGGSTVLLVCGVAVYTMVTAGASMGAADAIIKPQSPASSSEVIARAPPTTDIPADLPKPPVAPAVPYAPPQQVAAAPPPDPKPLDPDMTPMAIEARKRAWQTYYDRLAQRDEDQRKGLMDALGKNAAVEEAAPSSQAGQDGTGAGGAMPQQPGPMPQFAGAGGDGSQVGSNIAQHRRKFAFGDGEGFRQGGGVGPDGNYSPYMVTTPISRYELKATDIITGRMVSGLNSDGPGIIKAVVAQNVLDHSTGMHILIPQGSTLVGTYDNAIAYGQRRVVVAWQRVIYPPPCSESLTLGNMPGSDASGFAGFQDKTDNHYFQIFTNAILLSLFSAGTQLSQPQAQNTENINPGQTVASAMGQQLGQLGQEFARRGLDIPPTNVIRNGYPFTIMLTKDIAFARPWKACTAPGQSKMEIVSQ